MVSDITPTTRTLVTLLVNSTRLLAENSFLKPEIGEILEAFGFNLSSETTVSPCMATPARAATIINAMTGAIVTPIPRESSQVTVPTSASPSRPSPMVTWPAISKMPRRIPASGAPSTGSMNPRTAKSDRTDIMLPVSREAGTSPFSRAFCSRRSVGSSVLFCWSSPSAISAPQNTRRPSQSLNRSVNARIMAGTASVSTVSPDRISTGAATKKTGRFGIIRLASPSPRFNSNPIT